MFQSMYLSIRPICKFGDLHILSNFDLHIHMYLSIYISIYLFVLPSLYIFIYIYLYYTYNNLFAGSSPTRTCCRSSVAPTLRPTLSSSASTCQLAASTTYCTKAQGKCTWCNALGTRVSDRLGKCTK